MKHKLNWGILGVAKINNRLVPAFAKANCAELRAIASRSIDRAREAAAAAGIPVAHGSYEALLDDPNIDAVYIPLPNSLHGEWAMKAADRGKHVLCEKPLTPTADEAQRVIEHCQARGVRLMDGFMWPHHPRTVGLLRFLRSGGIGELRQICGAFTFHMKNLDRSNIRLQSEMAGGSLLDVGCYPVYGIRWAFGAEPVEVHARAEYVDGVDVAMTGTLWFGDGRRASFDCGFTTPFRQWLEIVGTEGVVRVNDMWTARPRAVYEVHRDGQPVEEVAYEGADQIVRMIDDFSSAVLHDKAIEPSTDEAVRTLRVLDALAKSAREGKSVAGCSST